MKGRFPELVVLSVIGLFVSAISGFAMAADTIKLGVAGAHSSDFASYGIPTLRAAKLVVKKVNSSGGVLGKKVAVLHDKGDYGKGQAELAKKHFEKAGVEVVLFEGVPLNSADYSAIVQKIKRSKADLVTWGGYYLEASKIVTLMRKKKMKTLFMGADGIKDDTFIKVAGKAAEGVYATGPNDVSKNQLFIDAKIAHQKAYGSDPGSFFDSGYAAALALLNAIEKAGSTDYKAIAKALKSQYIETPIGKISFDKNGDAIGAGFAVFNIKNGKFVETGAK